MILDNVRWSWRIFEDVSSTIQNDQTPPKCMTSTTSGRFFHIFPASKMCIFLRFLDVSDHVFQIFPAFWIQTVYFPSIFGCFPPLFPCLRDLLIEVPPSAPAGSGQWPCRCWGSCRCAAWKVGYGGIWWEIWWRNRRKILPLISSHWIEETMVFTIKYGGFL